MIDLHSHIVAGYDDGAEDEDESVAMARAWAADGVTTVAATPHVGAWAWGPPPDDLPARCQALNARLGSLQVPVQVVPGAEVYMTADAATHLQRGAQGHRPLGESHYVLVEFSLGQGGAQHDEGFFALQAAGWQLVLAHAERYPVFQRHPDRLGTLLGRGVLAQVTGGSLLGEFGPQAQRLAEQIVRANLGAIVASDAHRARTRPPRMGEARRRLVELVGDAAAERLTLTNPAAILADQPVIVDGDPSGLHGSQRSFLGVFRL